MYEFLAAVMRPDRRFPQLNDGFILWDANRLEAAARDLQRPDLEFSATCGHRGHAPAYASRSFPNAGVHVMRSGFDPDARYFVFDTGPYGGPHGHEDKLSFELYAFGAPFIVDPGSYTYQPDDPYRNYFVGSQGHNTILVDGASQVRRWKDSHMHPATEDRKHGDWLSDESFDWACGTYDEGYAEFSLRQPSDAKADVSTTHTRQVIFVKPDYWIIVDEIETDAVRDYTTLFHLAPDVEVLGHGGSGATLRSKRTSARLSLFPIGVDDLSCEVITGQESPIQGWYSQDHHKKEPASTIVFNTSPLKTTTLVWVLVPLSEEHDDVAVDVRPSSGSESGVINFEVCIAPGSDSVSVRPRHKGIPAATVNISCSDGRHWP
jgi:hypothetical protein